VVPHKPAKAEMGDPAYKAGSLPLEKEEAVCETASNLSGGKAEVSSASEKTPSIKEAFISGLRKGIGRFLERSGEVLSENLWPTISKVCLLKALGIEFSLESLKVLKEITALF
jgi:hypothetical protein